MRSGNLRALANIQERCIQDLVENIKAHISAKYGHPSRLVKQLELQKTGLHRTAKNHYKLDVLASRSNDMSVALKSVQNIQKDHWDE